MASRSGSGDEGSDGSPDSIRREKSTLSVIQSEKPSPGREDSRVRDLAVLQKQQLAQPGHRHPMGSSLRRDSLPLPSRLDSC